MRVLVTGANGMLGHDLCSQLDKSGHTVIPSDVVSAELIMDITDSESICNILEEVKPVWVINCAAFAKVDACETEEDKAVLVNGLAPGYLASACSKMKIRLLHISTDYVFDGMKTKPYKEDDTVNPINAYGRSKLKGEQLIASNMEDYLIIRTQWLFGKNGPNFVDTVLKLASEREYIDVVNDQFGSPTYTKDLSRAISLLIEKDAKGIFHISNRGSTSWFDLARRALFVKGSACLVKPVSTDMFPRPAKRPTNSILSTSKFIQFTGKLMPPWQIALDDYLNNTKTLVENY